MENRPRPLGWRVNETSSVSFPEPSRQHAGPLIKVDIVINILPVNAEKGYARPLSARKFFGAIISDQLAMAVLKHRPARLRNKAVWSIIKCLLLLASIPPFVAVGPGLLHFSPCSRSTMAQSRPFRILIVEDNRERELRLRSWLPPEARPVVASSAGRAIGILRRDAGNVYAGVILDHDLQEQRVTDMDQYLSGQDVAQAIIQHLSRSVLILVHSVNTSQSPLMAIRLENAGFDVTQIPMTVLTQERLNDWMAGVRERWQENDGLS
jgi:CheY-like chemotaxis protein